MQTLCLVMIVRDEAEVIERCLASVKHLIQHWVICDTGSTDRTREVIRESLAGIPGSLHDVPWRNFGWNRTQALQLARGKADYHLLLDADMTLNVLVDFPSAPLTEDAYLFPYTGPLEYWVERLLSDRHAWEYIGPAHEYVRSPTAKGRAKLPGVSVTHHGDGGCQRGKIERYLELLKQAHAEEPDNPRHVFYIAQSYGDLGNLPQAIEWHEKRAVMGDWEEEVWYSLYQIGRLRQRLGYVWPLVLEAYLRAYEYRPARIEPIFQVATYYRESGQNHLGRIFARAAIETPYPDDLLFIDKSAYDSQMSQEYATGCSSRSIPVED